MADGKQPRIAVLDDYQAAASSLSCWKLLDGRAGIQFFRDPAASDDALVARLRGFPIVIPIRERRIAGAALDVYDVEPLPAGHPLRSLDNVVLSPHLGYVTDVSYELFFTQAVENVVSYLDGELPRRTLNPEVLP